MQYRTVYKIVFVWVLLIALVALLGDVSVAASDGGRTAADFLQIELGAKPAGMGGAYTAVARGAEAAYWNPAGMVGLDGWETVLGHFSWYQDLNLEHAAVAYSANERTTVAAAITYLNYGSIEGFDVDGNPTGEIAAYDWAGALSVGYRLTENLALGITGKYINQRLDNVTGSAFAADIGLRWQMEKIAFAVAATNIGSGVKFESTTEDLPTTARIGVSAVPFSESFVASLEFEKKKYSRPVLRQGVELNFDGRYFLRTGYNFFLKQEEGSFGTGISMGCGFLLNKVSLDYAYTVQDKYSNDDLHRFSLGLRF
jgi:hypothetical protein